MKVFERDNPKLAEYLIMGLTLTIIITIAIPDLKSTVAEKKNRKAQSLLLQSSDISHSYYSLNKNYPGPKELAVFITKVDPSLKVSASRPTFKKIEEIWIMRENPHVITFCNRSQTKLFYCLRKDEKHKLKTNPKKSSLALPRFEKTPSREVARSTAISVEAALRALPTRTFYPNPNPAASSDWRNRIGKVG